LTNDVGCDIIKEIGDERMGEKETIYLDFDGTIVNSVKSFCIVFNLEHIGQKDFVKADHTKVNSWDLQDECPQNSNKIEEIFASDMFWHHLELINDNTFEILRQLKEEYNVIICSVGSPSNVSKKVEWCNRYLGIEDMIMLSQSKLKMDKSCVDMSKGIIIDDHIDNLKTSNADVKICFGEIKSWNEDWQGLRVRDWTELAKILL